MRFKPTHRQDAQRKLDDAAERRARFVSEAPLRECERAILNFEDKLTEYAKGLESGHYVAAVIDFDIEVGLVGLELFTTQMIAGGYLVEDLMLEMHDPAKTLVKITEHTNPPKQYAAWPLGAEYK